VKSKQKLRVPPHEDILWLRGNLLRWYKIHNRNFPWRHASASKYSQIIAEVLLQRTRAEVAAKAFKEFIRRFPSWKSISRAPIADLEEIFKPLGLWRRRARSLKALGKAMDKRKGIFPKDRDEVESLPGVGQYVANAVSVFCNSSPAPLLDTNMARLLERFFWPRRLADIRDDLFLQTTSHRLVHSRKYKEVNWAVLDFASAICTLRPKCEICPLRTKCTYFKARHKRGIKPNIGR
jgi:A/G-specific adenine glycosylase